jgi:hypothetical protein
LICGFRNIISKLQTTRTNQASSATERSTEAAWPPSESNVCVDKSIGADRNQEMTPTPSGDEASDVKDPHGAQHSTAKAETTRSNVVCPQRELTGMLNAVAQDEERERPNSKH